MSQASEFSNLKFQLHHAFSVPSVSSLSDLCVELFGIQQGEH